MPRDLLIAISGGLMSAVAAVAFFGGSVFSLLFVYFASVPLLMVGLGLGPRAVTIAAGAGICATGIVGGVLPAGLFGLIQALPAWIISRSTIFQKPNSEKKYEKSPANSSQEHISLDTPGLALAVLALLAGLIIFITAAGAGDGGMKGMIEVYLSNAFKAMASAMATAFSTSSSSATLPVTMKCVKENVKASKEVSGFVLPMGATINMDGTALYECAGVIFISQVLGVELTLSQQFIVVITALLASIGAAGIPSAGLVMIFIVTQAVGFNNDDVALIIGAMLAVDRPLDMLRTMVNVTSDSVGTAIIAHSEGEDLY